MARLPDIIDRLQGLSLDQIAEISRGSRGHYQMAVLSRASSGDFSSCIALKVVPSSREFGIVHVPKELKAFFPGYRSQFVLETDVQPFVMHLTGGNGADLQAGVSLDDAVGQKDIGQYLCHPRSTEIDMRFSEISHAASAKQGSFKRFYDAHQELRPDDFLVICRRVGPRDNYVLTRIIRNVTVSQ